MSIQFDVLYQTEIRTQSKPIVKSDFRLIHLFIYIKATISKNCIKEISMINQKPICVIYILNSFIFYLDYIFIVAYIYSFIRHIFFIGKLWQPTGWRSNRLDYDKTSGNVTTDFDGRMTMYLNSIIKL